MKLKECIILAGGLGTRLRPVVTDIPKCMAPVAGHPFLYYVINYLVAAGIEKFIFSLGYKHTIIEEYLYSKYPNLNFECVVEQEPLGTGGAIKAAASKASAQHVMAANGDTLFAIEVQDMATFHLSNDADCTMALKQMQNFSRYGVVEIGADQRVTDFKEKKYYREGYINGGVYVLNRINFLRNATATKFSFETDFLEQAVRQSRIYGVIQDGYFIDIGIPEDYERAQVELKDFL